MDLFKFKFECIFVSNLLRVVNCKVFRKCIVFILVDYCILMLASSTVARVPRFPPVTGNVSTTKFTFTTVDSSTSVVMEATFAITSETEWTVSLGARLSKGQVTGHNTTFQ